MANNVSVLDDYTEDIREQIMFEVYGKRDLGENDAFRGGYINFGYWKNVLADRADGPLSTVERIKASEDLYQLVITHLDVKEADEILEVGCGKGYGALYLANQSKSKSLVCVDLVPEQIERCKQLHGQLRKQFPWLHFELGAANMVKRPRASFSKIFSVEAIQHFSSITQFAAEARRLLKPDGKIVMAAHLATSMDSLSVVKNRLLFVKNGEDKATPVDVVTDAFTNEGFTAVKVESIGKDVFEGCDRWREQMREMPVYREMLSLFHEGHLDYYLFVFDKAAR